jgi:type IV secretory pathway TraG/TraD family ATPase VirD4
MRNLDPDVPEFGDECQAKADANIKTGSNESQPHFPDSARSGVTAVIMAEVKDAKAQGVPPSLPNVRAVLTQETEKLRASVKKMVASGDFDISTRAAKFLADNTEIQNIKSTIETQTAWMTKPMRDDMDVAGGVDFHACTVRPTTVYIIIPTKELQAKATYLRLALSSALRALYRHDGIPTSLVAEEAFVIGHLAEFEQACSILRGFRSRLIVVFQSLQQIKKLYPDTWGLFTAGAVIGFRPADLETAEWMTKRAGEEIVPVLSAADPSSVSDFGARPNWQQQKRERIPLAKMFGMPQGRALVWLPNEEAPHVARVRGYFEIPQLDARASPNPYYQGVTGNTGGRVKGIAAAFHYLRGFLPAGVRPFMAAPVTPGRYARRSP